MLVPYAERKKLIGEIERVRGRKLLTYVTTLRPNVLSLVDPFDLRVLTSHLSRLGDKPIDLFLVTFGGVSTVPLATANLVRSSCEGYEVLIPGFAASAGTSIALGADKIVMGPAAMLTPVDPKVANEFNPEAQGQPIGISVEDISGFLGMLKDKFELKDEHNLAALLDHLPEDIRPLALGNAYRHYLKSREDTRKLLTLHMDPEKDKAVIDKISEALIEKLYFHEHLILRSEARQLGLKVVDAESVNAGNGRTLSDVMWDLYRAYERDMQFMVPYVDEPPDIGAGKETRVELSSKVIESAAFSSDFVIEQRWRNLPFPQGSIPTQIAGPLGSSPAVFVPPDKLLPLVSRGALVPTNKGIFEKFEVTYWKGYEPP